MKVKELLSDPNKWCRGHFAVTGANKSVRWDDDEACMWCLVGALRKCYPDPSVWMEVGAVIETAIAKHDKGIEHKVNLNRCSPNLPPLWATDMVEFNDDAAVTHSDLVEILEEADV